MEGESQGQEIREEVSQTIRWVDKITRGDYAHDYPPEEGLDPREVFSGLVLDLNDKTLNPAEIARLERLIEEKLGSKPDEAPVRGRYKHADGQTTVTIYDVALGQEGDKWYISQWKDEGTESWYILWSGEMYSDQIEAGILQSQEGPQT